jgi:hypothetical protein
MNTLFKYSNGIKFFLSVAMPLFCFAQEETQPLILPPDATQGIQQQTPKAPSPTCDVDIEVLEKGTRKPLPSVNVYWLPDGVKAVTDENAVATFEGLPCGDLQWVVNIAGYERLDVKKDIASDASFTVYVMPAGQQNYRTVVTEYLDRDGSKRTIAQEDFINAVGSRGDPIIALENEPGFGSFSNEGGIILQGADPEDTRFYVNGHEVPLIFHSLGFSSIFIPDFIGSVDLLTAGFGSEYGRTIAGNINLTTKAPASDRIHALAYVDLLTSAALVQGPIDQDKKHTFSLGGRVSYIGPVFNLVTSEDDNVTFNQVPQFYDLQGNYQWQINDRWKFDLLGFGAKDQLRLRVKDSEDPLIRGDIAFKTSFFRFIPRIRYTDGENDRFEFSMAHGIDYIDQKIDDFFFDATIYQPTFRSEWQHDWHPQFTSIVGLDTVYTDFDADLNVPAGTFPNSEDSDAVPGALRDIITKRIQEKFWDYGSYVRLNIQDKQARWLISPNARLDYSELTENVRISPRIEITRTLNKVWKLRAATGVYYQTPQAPEVEASFGNPELNDVRSYHYALTAFFDQRKVQGDGFWGDVTAFVRDDQNVVVDTNELVTRDGQQVPLRYTNEGQGYAVGGQTSIQYKKGNFQGAAAYTLLWSRRKEPGTGYYPTDGDQRHNLNIRGRYQFGQWELSSRVRFISGRRETPFLRAYYDLDNDVYLPIEGEENSDQLPNFLQVDLRLDRKWVYNRWILSLYVDVQNITNRNNGSSYDYAFDYSSRTVEGGLPILPTFGVKGEF